MLIKVAKHELFHAQIALLTAIGLQFVVWWFNHDFSPIQYTIIIAEVLLLLTVGAGASLSTLRKRSIHRLATFTLLSLMTIANISSLVLVLNSLIGSHNSLTGLELLASAIAIFATNIIVYALWYWELDSPALSSVSFSKHDKDFQFTQQDIPSEFPDWRPEFADYLYVSMTNAVNFAPADTRPLSRNAKVLMGSQSIISVFTLAIVVARSVNILGS